MQHLGVLERAGLVIVKGEGRTRWNYLNVIPILQIYERWISQYASKSVDLLARMKHGIEELKSHPVAQRPRPETNPRN